MSFGGFGGGSPMFGGGGGSRTAASPGGGLPFAGIPPELQDGVDKLLADEPEYPTPSAKFTYRNDDERSKRLTLRALIFAHWRLGVFAVLLVCIVSVTNQVGPALIGYAIDHGHAARSQCRLRCRDRLRRPVPCGDRRNGDGAVLAGARHRPAGGAGDE